MKVRLVSKTEVDPSYLEEIALEEASSEALMIYCARVSSPNQENPSYEKLLEYCYKKKHWSVFEMVDVTMEIETTRMISAQILRHRSFSFQEFSQRYAKAGGLKFPPIPRLQDTKNRQSSIDTDDPELKEIWYQAKLQTEQQYRLYSQMVALGIAKEVARATLPMCAETKLYMKGSLRSWVHYLEVRTEESTQKEHREVALAIQKELAKAFPTIAKVAGWRAE